MGLLTGRFFLSSIGMSGKNINVNLNNKKNKRRNFYKNKRLFNIDGIDVNKISVSKNKPYDKKLI